MKCPSCQKLTVSDREAKNRMQEVEGGGGMETRSTSSLMLAGWVVRGVINNNYDAIYRALTPIEKMNIRSTQHTHKHLEQGMYK